MVEGSFLASNPFPGTVPGMSDSKVPSLSKSLAIFVLSILGLAAITVLVAGQILLLASLAAAPFGWSVPLLAIPSSLADVTVTIAAIVALFLGTQAVAKVADAL